MLIFGTLPKICFAGGMTSLLFERKIRIFDYPEVRRAVPEPDSRERGEAGGGSGYRDRVYPQTELPEGTPGEGDHSRARRSRRAGVHFFRNGTLLDVQAMAQQANRQDLPGSR